MGKSQVPKGATKKEKCWKCGEFYFPMLRGNSLELTTECSTCNPKLYEKKKEE